MKRLMSKKANKNLCKNLKLHNVKTKNKMKKIAFTQDELDDYEDEINELTSKEKDLFYKFEDRCEDVEECLELVSTYSNLDDYDQEIADFILKESDIGGYDLDDYVSTISSFDSEAYDIFQALITEEEWDFNSAVDCIKNGNYVVYGSDYEEVGRSWIDGFGSIEEAIGSNQIDFYFDYEAFGKDLVSDFSMVEVNGNYVEVYE